MRDPTSGSEPVSTPEEPTRRCADRLVHLSWWLALLAAAFQASGRYLQPITDAFVNVTGSGFYDLHLRQEEIRRWFAGEPVYEGAMATVYPPATFTLLWPLAGALPTAATHVLWVLLSLGTALGLSIVLYREACALSLPQRLLAFMLVPSAYATGMTVVIGQSGLVVLLAAVLATLIAIRRTDLLADVAAAALFVFALVKPTFSVPFFWPFVMAPRRFRPALLTVLGYTIATIAAVLAQPRSVAELIGAWKTRLAVHAAGARGYGSLDNFATALGRPDLYFPAALALLAGFGILVYCRRHADPWVLLGLAALVARFFAYHRHYDDVLVIVAAFSLLRLTALGPSVPERRVATATFALLLIGQLTPTRFLGREESYWAFNWLQIGSRLIALVTLVWFALRSSPTRER